MGTFIETESGIVAAWDWGRRSNREPLFNRWAVFVWHDEKVVEMVKFAQPCECT